jgi:hypothetical protein
LPEATTKPIADKYQIAERERRAARTECQISFKLERKSSNAEVDNDLRRGVKCVEEARLAEVAGRQGDAAAVYENAENAPVSCEL